MESLSCRSPRACASCPWSTREGACALEAEVDLALEALAPKPLVIGAARRALA
jgi:hypothetical protein